MPESLNQAVADGRLAKYEATGRQVILYLRAVPAGGTLTLDCGLGARWPPEVTTPPIEAYL